MVMRGRFALGERSDGRGGLGESQLGPRGNAALRTTHACARRPLPRAAGRSPCAGSTNCGGSPLRWMGVGMNCLSAEQLHARKVAELGLDASALDLTSTEALAAALRRAAGFLCPCAAPTLVRAVVSPLEGLVPELHAVKVLVEDTLEAMVAHGDLL